MTNKIILLSFLIISCFACENTGVEKKDYVDLDTVLNMHSMNDRGIPLDTLEKKVLENGDTVAFDDLMIELLDYDIEERVKWSKIMAEKYNYPRAYSEYFVAISFKCASEPPLSCLTKNEKDTFILLLNRAIKNGDSSAIELKKEYNIK